MFAGYGSCCIGGILTKVAFHVLNLYKVVSEGRHRGYCIIGQFTDVLRSLEGVPLEWNRVKGMNNEGVIDGKLDKDSPLS